MLKQIYKKSTNILLLICCTPSIVFAGFTITPLNLEISQEEKVVNMTLNNNDDIPKPFEVKALKAMHHNDGKVTWETTDDFFITPKTNVINPKSAQTIRLSIKKNVMYTKGADIYKISAKELPRKMNLSGSQVQLVTEFRIPLKFVDHVYDNAAPDVGMKNKDTK